MWLTYAAQFMVKPYLIFTYYWGFLIYKNTPHIPLNVHRKTLNGLNWLQFLHDNTHTWVFIYFFEIIPRVNIKNNVLTSKYFLTNHCHFVYIVIKWENASEYQKQIIYSFSLETYIFSKFKKTRLTYLVNI